MSYLAYFISFFIIAINSLNALAENSANSDVNIAYELTNPLSNLQLIDIQWNHSHGLGLNNAGKDQTLQIAPKIKIDVSENWKTLTVFISMPLNFKISMAIIVMALAQPNLRRFLHPKQI